MHHTRVAQQQWPQGVKNFKGTPLFLAVFFVFASLSFSLLIEQKKTSNMGEDFHENATIHQTTKATPFSLPPGCRFYPSDHHLLCFYLANKNRDTAEDRGNRNTGYDLIREMDLYSYEPNDLPEDSCYAYGYRGRKRHWYCYTGVPGVFGERRRAKGGYWRRKGRVRDVVGPSGKGVIGTRTRFVFYLRSNGESVRSGVRTDWMLYEYALVDHVKASFVLCRVFVKSRRVNSVSDNVLSSCAEESVSAVRHVGVQHDGYHTPDSGVAKVHNGNLIDGKNGSSKYSARLSRELDDQVIVTPVSVASVQFPLGIQSHEQVGISGLTGNNVFVDAEATQQLLSILDDDFIELDDLVD